MSINWNKAFLAFIPMQLYFRINPQYSKAPFQITNAIDASLQNKRERFIQETGTEKAVHLTMITTMGLSDNPYAWDIQSVVTMDDLFIL